MWQQEMPAQHSNERSTATTAAAEGQRQQQQQNDSGSSSRMTNGSTATTERQQQRQRHSKDSGSSVSKMTAAVLQQRTCIQVHPVLIEFGELANIPAATQNHTSATIAGEQDKQHITHREISAYAIIPPDTR